MQIRSNGGADFKALAHRLRKAGPAGKGVRRELTRELRALLKPIVKETQDAVRDIKVSGSHGGGAAARARADVAREMRRQSVARAKGRATRARRTRLSTGLRARVARGVKSRVSYSGHRYGAQITASAAHLPWQQRKLPRHLNNPKGWRHPVFGDRDNWVTQVGEPWFDKTIDRHVAGLRRDVARVIDRYLHRKIK